MYLLQKALYGGNFEQASVAARQAAVMAQDSGDEEGAKMYTALAKDYYDKAIAKAQAPGVEANRAKPDLNPLGIPTVTPPVLGQPPVAQPMAPQPTPQPKPAALPPEAMRMLSEGQPTPFRNGQVWTLQKGQPVRIK
jgi:hypothetical protein